MVELRDQTKGLLSNQAGRMPGALLALQVFFEYKALLCASLKIRHLIIKHFFFKIFSPSSKHE